MTSLAKNERVKISSQISIKMGIVMKELFVLRDIAYLLEQDPKRQHAAIRLHAAVDLMNEAYEFMGRSNTSIFDDDDFDDYQETE
jgi:hypothetical protein